MTRPDFWGDPYDGARHPDTPEPGDYVEPDDPPHQFDPQDDADLGPAPKRTGRAR